ncbi:hypothetical protein C0J52_13852, partial [Blattella germanica]
VATIITLTLNLLVKIQHILLGNLGTIKSFKTSLYSFWKYGNSLFEKYYKFTILNNSEEFFPHFSSRLIYKTKLPDSSVLFSTDNPNSRPIANKINSNYIKMGEAYSFYQKHWKAIIKFHKPN